MTTQHQALRPTGAGLNVRMMLIAILGYATVCGLLIATL